MRIDVDVTSSLRRIDVDTTLFRRYVFAVVHFCLTQNHPLVVGQVDDS